MRTENDSIKLAFADFRRSIIRWIVIVNVVQAALLVTLILLAHRPS